LNDKNKEMYYNNFKNFLESFGYKLISKEYINSSTHYLIECPNEHQYYSTINNFKSGKRCKECQGIKKYTKEDIINYCNNYGIEILDFNNYKNVFTKLKTRCKHGHENLVSFRDLMKSIYKCSTCADIEMGNKIRLSYDYVYNYFKQYKYKLLSKTYEYAILPLEVICPEGHTTSISFDKFRSGHRCWVCYINNNRGENHPNWMGGISKINLSIRATPEYIEWRNAVFKKDDYTCQVCGEKSKILNAHHINNFSDYPELRFNINNGITICEKHHLQSFKNAFHNLYTQFNNTKEQLEEYIQRYKSGEFDELRKSS